MRWSRTLLFALIVAPATITVTATPAAAGDLGELEAEEADLLGDQERLDGDIAEATRELTAGEDLIAHGGIELELLAADKIGLLAARESPAAARQALVLFRYTQGDPRLDSFLSDLIAGRSEIGPAVERSLYTVLLDDASDDVQRIDEQVDELDQRREDLDGQVADAQEELPELRQRIEESVAERQDLAASLEEVQAALAWERGAADRGRLTGLPEGGHNDTPALAVKIDNVAPARPQAGLNQADIVYEEQVEGNLSRLIAIFHSAGSDPVGPIRSVRTSDVLILSNWNRPLLANSGGNANVMSTLRESPIIDVGASAVRSPYYRQRGRPAPHNLFATTSQLRAAGEGSEAGAPPQLFSYRRPGTALPDDATPSEGITIRYGGTTVSYGWNAASGGWDRTQDGAAHNDADGVRISPPNVVVQYVDYRPSTADARSPESNVLGSGDILAFTEGHVIEGTWTRLSLADATIYTDADGEALELTPGRTWISLAPNDFR